MTRRARPRRHRRLQSFPRASRGPTAWGCSLSLGSRGEQGLPNGCPGSRHPRARGRRPLHPRNDGARPL